MNRDKAGWRERVYVRNSVVQGLNLPLEKKFKKIGILISDPDSPHP